MTREINEAKMLEEVRQLLHLSITDFTSQMNWPNTKYYGYIKNGRKGQKQAVPVQAHPTIYKIFNGFNYAFAAHETWAVHKAEIIQIILKNLLPEH